MITTDPSARRNILILTTLLIFFWPGSTKDRPLQGNPIAKVTLCDLAEHSETYAGKIIETQASVIGNDFWIADFSGAKCSAYMRLLLTFPKKIKPEATFAEVHDENYKMFLREVRGGTAVLVTVRGRFDPIFVWRNQQRVRLNQSQERSFGRKDQYDGRIVFYSVSDVVVCKETLACAPATFVK